MNIREMIEQARRYYPNSRHLQRQWIRKSWWLLEQGKHALQTGGFKSGTA